MTNDEIERWDNVARHIRARLIETRVFGNLTEIARQSRVSDATWRALLAGRRLSRPDKRLQVTDYLGWTPESFDLMLAGHDPVPLAPEGHSLDVVEDTFTVRIDRADVDGLRTTLERMTWLMAERYGERTAINALTAMTAKLKEGAQGDSPDLDRDDATIAQAADITDRLEAEQPSDGDAAARPARRRGGRRAG